LLDFVFGFINSNKTYAGGINEEQIVQVLTKNVIGRIGCYADKKIYIVPVTFLYDDGGLLVTPSSG